MLPKSLCLLIISCLFYIADSSTQEGDLQDCSPEVLHLLLVELLNKNSEHFGVTNELKESFFENLRKGEQAVAITFIVSSSAMCKK